MVPWIYNCLGPKGLNSLNCWSSLPTSIIIIFEICFAWACSVCDLLKFLVLIEVCLRIMSRCESISVHVEDSELFLCIG